MSQRTRLTAGEAAFAQAQRVGRLATADAAGHPFAVPVCYAYDGTRFFTPLDEKPKHTTDEALRRVRNIQARGEAALLIDRYDDDWSRLGYLLARGAATLVAPGDPAHAAALGLLRARYAQYVGMALETRPIIALTPAHVASWGPAVRATAPVPDAPLASEWLRAGRAGAFVPLARGRRSVRHFEQRAVPRAVLDAMLEAARWAPSPHGRQPWRFAVLTRTAAKQQLAEAMGEEWQRTLAMDGQPADIIARRLESSRERIRTAPALILACLYLAELDHYPDADRQRAEETMAVQSLGAAIQNMLLAAFSLGLDTGWMCAPLFCPETVRSALGLDAALIPHALIPVGYAATDPRRRAHRPVSDLVIRFD